MLTWSILHVGGGGGSEVGQNTWIKKSIHSTQRPWYISARKYMLYVYSCLYFEIYLLNFKIQLQKLWYINSQGQRNSIIPERLIVYIWFDLKNPRLFYISVLVFDVTFMRPQRQDWPKDVKYASKRTCRLWKKTVFEQVYSVNTKLDQRNWMQEWILFLWNHSLTVISVKKKPGLG